MLVLRIGTKLVFVGGFKSLLPKCSLILKHRYMTPQLTVINKYSLTLFFLGDLGYYDNEGRLYYVDRIKDLIKCRDAYVSAAELEDILLSHGAVKEACVVGIPHLTRGDDPTAFVVLHDSSLPSKQMEHELKIFVKGEKKIRFVMRRGSERFCINARLSVDLECQRSHPSNILKEKNITFTNIYGLSSSCSFLSKTDSYS